MTATLNAVTHKACLGCGLDFPIDAYPTRKDRHGEHRPHARCRPCLTEWNRNYIAAHPEKKAAERARLSALRAESRRIDQFAGPSPKTAVDEAELASLRAEIADWYGRGCPL